MASGASAPLQWKTASTRGGVGKQKSGDMCIKEEREEKSPKNKLHNGSESYWQSTWWLLLD